jgi:hypothetical protein
MFDSAEKKINALEFRIFELERQMKSALEKKTDNYNLKVLQYGLTFLAVLGVSFLGTMLYRI